MNKFLIAVSALTLLTACSEPVKEKKVSDTIRSRAEKAFCGLDYSMFQAPKGASFIDQAMFEALKKNVVKPDDSEAIKTEKEKKNGLYSLVEAEVFKFVSGKESATSIHTEGSVRVSFNAASGWTNDELTTSQVCDTLNTASQSTPHQKPGPGKYVNLQVAGVEQFEIPSLDVKSKFESRNEKARRKVMSQQSSEELEKPGDDRSIPGLFTSVTYYTLKDGEILAITYSETATSVSVVRATYKKQAQ
jgi:hypothetical protein